MYLVRSGELHVEMFDAVSAHVFERALAVVAPIGDEARSLAFLDMRAASLPKDSPEQAQILEHLRALQAWMKDTRQLSDVENSSMNQRAFAERAMLEPTAQTVADGLKATDRWIGAAIDFNADFKPGIDRPRREQLLEAYRGIRTGALVLAALYLRQGDASGASSALGRPEVRRVAPARLIDRLDAAAKSDVHAWRELAALYASANAPGTEESLPIPPEIARGAAWGAMVEGYRHNPFALDTTVPLAEMLVRLGMADVAATVLTDATRDNRSPDVVSGLLGFTLKTIMRRLGASSRRQRRLCSWRTRCRIIARWSRRLRRCGS